MKKTLLSVLVLAVLFPSPEVNAEPKNITTISADQVSELEVMHQHATDLLIKNDFQGALRAYSDILLAEPDDETAYTGLGQIYMVLGQLKKAHEVFENALHINPDNEVALLGIQKIMDPDGVEGMTNHAQVEEEPFSPVPKKKKTSVVTRPSSFVRRPSREALRLGLLNAQRIQMSLKNAGVYAGPVNGMLGNRTRRAIRRFQKIRGFKETGATDNVTMQALLLYLAYNGR